MSVKHQWPIAKFKDVTTLITDGTHHSPETFSSGDYLYLTSKNIRKNYLDLSNIAYVNESVHREIYKRCPVKRGDVLLTKDGANTGLAAENTLEQEFSLLSSVALLRPAPDRLDSRYLVHWINSPMGQNQIVQNMSGSAIRRLILAEINKKPIPLPPLSEQKRIADILDKADAIRRKRQQAAAILDEVEVALFQNRFGDPVSNRRGWSVVPLGELFAEPPNYGTMIKPSSSVGEWLDLRVANIQDGKLTLEDRKYVNLPASMVNRHEVREGDLLLARAIGSLDHLGKCIIAQPGGEKWAFDSHLMRVRFNQNRVRSRFVHAFLTSPGGRHEFLLNSRRSAVQFNINTKEMAKIRIPLPSLSQQDAFVEELDHVQNVGYNNTHARNHSEHLFNSLVQRAFKGEL